MLYILRMLQSLCRSCELRRLCVLYIKVLVVVLILILILVLMLIIGIGN